MISYNPDIHHRHSIRLKGYDYSQDGLYFVTICCQNRVCRFGQIIGRKMILNELGNIVHNEWHNLTNKYPYIDLYEFIVMPNHFHGILRIVGAGFARPDNSDNSDARPNNSGNSWINAGQGQANPAPTNTNNPPTLGNIIGYFKYQTTKKINLPDKLWQRNYYEHIIRNEQAYQNISNYIIGNPTAWQNDKFYFKQ
jgi:REP element-mobilizing transposase RayT